MYLHLIIFISIYPLLVQSQTSNNTNEVVKTIPVKASQGVAVDENYYYAISNRKIVKYDKKTDKHITTWSADRKNQKFKHFQHMNSGSVIDGKLYCAHSRFPLAPNDNTVEIWNVDERQLEHERTVRIPGKYGSLTWIDKHADFWWMCYAVYGKGKNKLTRLVKYKYTDGQFTEVKNWTFPPEVIDEWGSFSCSGGSWGEDDLLYTTGHDHKKAYVLKIEGEKLKFVRVEKNVGFYGQAIAWDRHSKKRILWGIVKQKNITQTHIPLK